MDLTHIALLTCACLSVKGDITKDLQYLAAIFPGFYDNTVQYENDIKNDIPETDRHVHLSMSVSPEKVPFLEGRANFYLEEFVNGDRNDLVRQRIYSYGVDEEERIHLKFYTLKDQKQFAHASPNSPLFKNLTMKDVVYVEGCDVYWDRVTEDLFRSHMFNTCLVEIDGAEILITDTNDMTSSYLTVKETWISVANGSIVRSIPVPYNLTKQIVGTETKLPLKTMPRQGQDVYLRYKNQTKTQLRTFDDLLQALVSGQAVRYYITPTACRVTGATGANSTQIGGYIDTFEYFSSPTFGPLSYIGYASLSYQRDDSGSLVVRLREGSIYKTGDVKLTVTTLSPDYQTVIHKQYYDCTISPDSSSVSASFFADGASLTRLAIFGEFVTALQSGSRIRATIDYGLCSLKKDTIGGADIEDFEVSADGNHVLWSQLKTISNSQGGGYVNDILTSRFFSNGSVVFTASEVVVDTDKTLFVNVITCAINGPRLDGGVELYQSD
ncbi:uncharacterized protein [Haliotis cracherodii]|uniref:uncharacterized protein n=1 Tax=Haliotis cracherodii TaxID=6455 RepID=UPI0039EACA1E